MRDREIQEMREKIGRSRINTERFKNDRRERREIQVDPREIRLFHGRYRRSEEDLKEIWIYSEKKWKLGENRKI
jgi:hypothetical protein